MTRQPLSVLVGVVALAGAAPAAAPAAPTVTDDESVATLLDQGWDEPTRAFFYTGTEGGRMIRVSWLKALTQAGTNTPFLADRLARYGYLPFPDHGANPDGLPIGFTVDGAGPDRMVGFACSACHTTQIRYNGQNYRIDGGPSRADYQAFASDLVKAARWTLADHGAWTAFAGRVLGSSHGPAEEQALHRALAAWVADIGGFEDLTLPSQNVWGPARLDAFGTVYNRLLGHGLGAPDNLRPADAPTRYPFLWNIPFQDKVEWNGISQNGLYMLALPRNAGTAFGIFADFKPVKKTGWLGGIDYLKNSSIRLDNIQKVEVALHRLKPPVWPAAFPLDRPAALRGKAIYEANCTTSCHGIAPGALKGTWKTPIEQVGTDDRMAVNTAMTGDPGILTGTQEPRFVGPTLAVGSAKSDILANAAVGLVLQSLWANAFSANARRTSGAWNALSADFDAFFGGSKSIGTNLVSAYGQGVTATQGTYKLPPEDHEGTGTGGAYEARVLGGIWAAAPYLHNGSVPNLWELLTPPDARVTQFATGTRVFDPVKVGFSTDPAAPGNHFTFVATRTCTGPQSGNCNQGHDYGTHLSDADKTALIEYLKTL